MAVNTVAPVPPLSEMAASTPPDRTTPSPAAGSSKSPGGASASASQRSDHSNQSSVAPANTALPATTSSPSSTTSLAIIASVNPDVAEFQRKWREIDERTSGLGIMSNFLRKLETC